MRKCSFISVRSTRLSSLYDTELRLRMRLRLSHMSTKRDNKKLQAFDKMGRK